MMKFITLLFLLVCSCFTFLYDRYDFTQRNPVPVDSVQVFTETNPPLYSYKAVVGMLYGPQYEGGKPPTPEQAVAKFKEKAASLGCDAIIFMGQKSGEDEVPGKLYWVGDKPYYTGPRKRTASAWLAKGIVFE